MILRRRSRDALRTYKGSSGGSGQAGVSGKPASFSSGGRGSSLLAPGSSLTRPLSRLLRRRRPIRYAPSAIAATPSTINNQPHQGIPPDSSVACTVVSLMTVVGGAAGPVTVFVFLASGGGLPSSVTVLVSVTVFGGGAVSRVRVVSRSGVVSGLPSTVTEEAALFACVATVPAFSPEPHELPPQASSAPATPARTI